MLKTCFAALLAAICFSSVAIAQDNELNWNMDTAIKQLNSQANDFETVLAQVDAEWNPANDAMDHLSSGRMIMNQKGELRIDTKQQRILMIGNWLYYYDQKLARVEEYKLSSFPDRLEPFIPLGFSITGKDLERDYLVTYIGEQKTGDRRLLGLELTPKSDKARSIIAKIDLWFDQASWMPAKQVFTRASGGTTLTLSYTLMARNLNLNKDLFDDDWPKGTQKVKQ